MKTHGSTDHVIYVYIYMYPRIDKKKKTIPQSGMGIKMETQGSTNHIICISVCVCVWITVHKTSRLKESSLKSDMSMKI